MFCRHGLALCVIMSNSERIAYRHFYLLGVARNMVFAESTEILVIDVLHLVRCLQRQFTCAYAEIDAKGRTEEQPGGFFGRDYCDGVTAIHQHIG